VCRGYFPAVFLSKPRLSKILSTVGMPQRRGALRHVRHSVKRGDLLPFWCRAGELGLYR